MAEIIDITGNTPEKAPEKKPLKARLLSEFTMDDGADVMIQIAEPLLDILSDEELIESLKGEVGEKASYYEIQRVGIIKFAKLFYVVLNKKRDIFFQVITPFFGVDTQVIHKAPMLKVIGEVWRIWRDGDFQSFLSQLRDGGAN